MNDDLLGAALAALGLGPSFRELELVADSLRCTDAEDALSAVVGDGEAWDHLVALAESCGSSGFVALDAVTAVTAGADALVRRSINEGGD